MTYFVRAPGTCGEFIQGSLDGHPFLVTCPINRYSYAMSDVQHPLPHYHCSLQVKAALAKEKTIDLLGVSPTTAAPIYVRSDILQGKGMASSSADISVVAMATALSCGRPLSLAELTSICLSIEPSDASFYPSIVQFDYREGSIARILGKCPPIKILIFDEGGTIDTLTFNKQPGLLQLIQEKEALIEEALDLMKRGLETHDLRLLGQAATMSAFANQRILHKPSLYAFHEIGTFYHAVGTIIAHSGTVMGLLFQNDSPSIEACRQEIERSLPALQYIDTVETAMDGLTYMKK